MTYLIPEATRAALRELAEPLRDAARVALDEGLAAEPRLLEGPAEFLAEMMKVQTFVFAVEALLDIEEFTQVGIVQALASVTGSALARCTGDRRVLWQVFQQQCAASLQEVGAITAPAQGGVQ